MIRTKNPHAASWQKDMDQDPNPKKTSLYGTLGGLVCCMNKREQQAEFWDLFHLFALEVRVPINGQQKFRQRFFVVGQGKAKFPKDVTLFVCQLVRW